MSHLADFTPDRVKRVQASLKELQEAACNVLSLLGGGGVHRLAKQNDTVLVLAKEIQQHVEQLKREWNKHEKAGVETFRISESVRKSRRK